MKLSNVPFRDNRPTFSSETTTEREAKRKASLIINRLREMQAENVIDQFNYITPQGTYIYRRDFYVNYGGNWDCSGWYVIKDPTL